ncbi:hypothetical protein J3Q64DRAFT_1710883 [Phycomyces blakesleeanus]|uniref:Uncharacterized protein n=2 Tax=Phycomyces blakesleeanus TaxID=4837 RepID=A0A162WKE0_PHYB8|nr:hypothetical protein PHYBLDRAFT_63497 [Phycomyces blakesleeanus NRRL 1555(-)]OAD68595.1 hypothetical protein PHYBLDRAFT_63497 [Phycomyces blakesleeanus NRRL 1555(-)]|eukprot:XP_018286635.1 hypothetical protein PHYBLDRAFT_63497 [Phycomyces blakesleeanus NRRL 1555(-)]
MKLYWMTAVSGLFWCSWARPIIFSEDSIGSSSPLSTISASASDSASSIGSGSGYNNAGGGGIGGAYDDSNNNNDGVASLNRAKFGLDILKGAHYTLESTKNTLPVISHD